MTNALSEMMFSIVMPAYNEEAVIEATVTELCTHLDAAGYRYELIVVDDASRDRTPDIIAELAQRLPQIRPQHNPGPNGYGFAIRKGLEMYQGDAVVIVTSDGSDAPKDVAAYFNAILDGADCAFGSRFGPDSMVTGYPPVKKLLNRIFNRIVGYFAKSDYRDFTNGFKCYRRPVIDAMQPIISGQFNITIEMSLKAVLEGWKVHIVPNDWHQRDGGQSSFHVRKLIKPYIATLFYCLARKYIQSIRR